MKVSINSLQNINRHYKCTTDIATDGVEALVDKIGAQLGAVEEVIDIGSKYQGAIVVRVTDCVDHPNADKLHVCRIDDGKVVKHVERDKQGLIQVVCGAPNVREGMLAVWLPPGVTVPETVGKEPFVLEAREIRGEVSNGMLASSKELALGENHDGILEIDDVLDAGTDFAEFYGLKGDVVLDIENKMFTHRPDCFGYLGIDRELAGIQQMPFKSPPWYRPEPAFTPPETDELPMSVDNQLPKLVPRFSAIVMSVKVGPSPARLQVELAKAGLKSINNIVDFTNMYMLSTGQPLHAYDYDKVHTLNNGRAKLVVRHPHKGEKLKLLNGKEIEPRAEAIVIATDKQAIGLGGVMGGSETEVDETTTRIILESASFDMYSIRRTSMAHGLFTDAVTRFTKGQSPLQTLAVLSKVVEEIRRSRSGKVSSRVIDEHTLSRSVLTRGNLHAPVTVSASFINARLGLELRAAEIRTLLRNVEFEVSLAGDTLTVQAPFWRTDIEIPEDIVEEIGRLYGYDHLPLELPQRRVTPTVKDPLLTTKAAIRERLSTAGANEVLTYSFVHGGLLDKTNQGKEQAFHLSNALSPELQYYRITLLPSLLEKVHPNSKAGYDEFALFEIGRSHSLLHPVGEDGVPNEFEFTSLVVTANDKLKKTGAPYYQAKKYLTQLAGVPLEFKPVGEDMLQFPVVKPFDPKRAALVSVKGGEFLGIVGELAASVRRNLKLPGYTAAFEIDTNVLQKIWQTDRAYVALPRFPKVTQDLSLKVPRELAYQELFDFLSAELAKLQPKQTLPELSPVDIYQPADDPEHKHVTVRLNLASYERTLTDAEVTKLLIAVAAEATDKYGAERL